MLTQLGLEKAQPEPTKKVFLARQPGASRPYNQAELLRTAMEFEFEPVFLENLNFRESVQVMLGATHVVGPHGAGWANAMFLQAGVGVGMWTWAESMDDNWFANEFALARLESHVSLEAQKDSLGNIYIDPASVRKTILRVLAV
jgi:capsular polysaccharide biosynthesis protein